jgi:hypothetical protein
VRSESASFTCAAQLFHKHKQCARASRNSILAANSGKNLSEENILSCGETKTPEENSFPFVKFVQPLIGRLCMAASKSSTTNGGRVAAGR